MAKRYSGNLQINVTYDPHNFYRVSVSQGGKRLWGGRVSPAPSGFGPGIAYDSPRAYDEIAGSALSFADDEVGGIGDDADFKDDGTGYLIRRTPLTKRVPAHATKRGVTRASQGTQYRGVVVGKGLLLGGGKRHVSSWFKTPKEADDWAWAINAGNQAAKRPVALITIEKLQDGVVKPVNVIDPVKWKYAEKIGS